MHASGRSELAVDGAGGHVEIGVSEEGGREGGETARESRASKGEKKGVEEHAVQPTKSARRGEGEGVLCRV